MTSLDTALRDVIREIVREELDAARANGGMSGELMTVTEAAKHARVHVDTIRRWIRQGKLTEHRAGRLVRVRRAELDGLLDSPTFPVVVPHRTKANGRFDGGQRIRHCRPRPRAEGLSPEELARRDFGR